MNQEITDAAGEVPAEPEVRLPDFSFDDLNTSMRENALAMGWKTPMPVQAKAVPYLMSGRDMIVQSHTGSGKTGAFLIPLIQMIDPVGRYPQALILVPTRELAGQVYREFEALSAGMELRGALIYGGVGYGPQLDALRNGAQVIIGTPGRVLDHLGRRSMSLRDLRVAIFDEADEMLSMGFYPAMREVRTYLPRERLSWMFSATIPYKVQLLAEEFLTNPEFLSLSAGHESVNTMEHRYYQVPPMDKDLMLMRLIEMESPESAIIFCNTKSEVEYLATALRNRGYNADQISGDLSQKEREAAMSRIRTRETRFLVATDVAARGIDISDLAFVFQYDVPKDTESYLHRAGRTARAGNTGVVVTLIANISEKTDLKKIARKYNINFVEMALPSEEEVESRIAERLINLLEDRFRAATTRAQRERMKRFEPLVKSLAQTDDEWLLVAMLFEEIYQREFHAAPTSIEGPHGRDREERKEEGRRDEKRRSEKRSDERRSDEKRSNEKRGDERRSDEKRGDEKRGDEKRGDEKPRSAQPMEQTAGGPESREEGEGEVHKKKKRRRKRKRNRNRQEENAAATTEFPTERSDDVATERSEEPVESLAKPEPSVATDLEGARSGESTAMPGEPEGRSSRSSGSGRRGKKSKPSTENVATAEAELPGAVEPENVEAPPAEAVAAEPSRAPKRNRGKVSAEAATEVVAEPSSTPEEAPQPKRSRKKKETEIVPADAKAPTPDVVAESDEQPKRSRKKKPVEGAESVPEPAAPVAAKPKGRKKKEAEEPGTASEATAKPKGRRKKSD